MTDRQISEILNAIETERLESIPFDIQDFLKTLFQDAILFYFEGYKDDDNLLYRDNIKRYYHGYSMGIDFHYLTSCFMLSLENEKYKSSFENDFIIYAYDEMTK